MEVKTRITFTGDMSFSAFFQKAYQKETLIHSEILDFCNQSDGTVINYESPITPLRHTRKKRLAHRTDPEALNFIKDKFKYPVLSFANNHMMDYKSVGFLDSLEETKKRDIAFIGGGSNREEASSYVIIGEEIKVGILSVQYKQLRKLTKNFIGPLHETMVEDIEQRLKELRPQVDWIVLVYHGGDEFLHAPMPYTRKLIKKFLKLDIDVIVAHHPHVVQGYEYFGDKLVFYSLGNFIFDSTYQRVQTGTDQGMLVGLNFYKENYTFDSCPIQINREALVIEPGEKSPFFMEIQPKNYRKLWTYEAARKPQVLENSKLLRRTELEQMKEGKRQRKLEQQERIVQAERYQMLLQGISEEPSEVIFNENIEEETVKEILQEKKSRHLIKQTKKQLKKVVRTVFFNRQKNYRKMVLRMGRISNKLFNRGGNVYQ